MIKFNEIFKEARTDKFSHKYGKAYDLIINSILSNNPSPSILEIGVRHGNSVHAWAMSLLFDKIVGIDVHNNMNDDIMKELEPHNYSNIVMNAYTDNAVDLILKNHGKFDIIIDDGSHIVDHQLWFLENYAKLLTPNGVLVCEDVKHAELDNFKSIGLYIMDVRANKRRPSKFEDDILVLRYL